jgi:hypothetical protein
MRGEQERVRKAFFFEKKKQKTFDRCCGLFPRARLEEAKVFWFFFAKKNAFLLARDSCGGNSMA